MNLKLHLSRLAVGTAFLTILASGCASSSQQIQQPPMTPQMKSAVGTPDEMSPLAPQGATNVRKVGNQWTCEVNGQVMVYDSPIRQWKPKH